MVICHVIYIQVFGSQSATAFKLIQKNKCHVHPTAQQMARKQEEDRFKREQAKQKKKAEKDKQMNKSFKKDKESWSMDADEIN